MKSIRTKLREGRCQGIGRTYTPFYTSQEARSIGTSMFIPDPIEHRMVHLLSTSEVSFYYLLRWNDNTEYIREQYLLDGGYMNFLREMKGLPLAPPFTCYTTDFLVNEKDGGQHAYSVKSSEQEFDINSRKYRGRTHAYDRLIIRQLLEKEYWESQGIPFTIITGDRLNRIKARNIEQVFGYYNDLVITTREQKLMYLIAHKYYQVPMDEEILNPRKLLETVPFEIDSTYERMRRVYGEPDYGI